MLRRYYEALTLYYAPFALKEDLFKYSLFVIYRVLSYIEQGFHKIYTAHTVAGTNFSSEGIQGRLFFLEQERRGSVIAQ